MAIVISDIPRETTVVLAASIGPVPLAWPIFDLVGDASADLVVTVNDIETTAYTVTGTQEQGFNGSALAWSNVQITFDAPQTGTVFVRGARAPRRTANFQEGIGVPARDLNLVLNLITANLREVYDRVVPVLADIASALSQAAAYVAQAASYATNAATSAANAAASYALAASLVGILLDDGNQEDGAGPSYDDGDQP